jgi:hypothetical protein
MATETDTLEQRIEAGKALRERVSRASHNVIGNVKRDPVKLLAASSKGRVEHLVPLRYGRMLASPFTFYRGSAALQAHDLAATPYSGLTHQICGDAHLMNFGGFATAERNLVFDLNDFDETHPGPWEWDVKRLAASITVGARHMGFKSAVADEMVFNAVEQYRKRMAESAAKGTLDLWYEKLTFDYILQNAKFEKTRKAVLKVMDKAQGRTQGTLLPKMAQKTDGRWVMRDTPPVLFHFSGDAERVLDGGQWIKNGRLAPKAEAAFRKYLETLSPSHRHLLGNFRMQDLAFKVVGVGSVGTRCLALLMTDVQDQPLFLQIKQAVKSVLAPYVPVKSGIKHEGQRVVVGQRLMQSASDPFLGWMTGQLGFDFYVRQLRDMKVSFEIELFDDFLFGRYAWLCADTLARAHARAGAVAPQVSGYLGNKQDFAEALVGYANAYADQVERDYDAFRTACRQGRLSARTDADFAADLTI